jgi:hypothetical protein
MAYNKNTLFIADGGILDSSTLYPADGSLYCIDLDTKIMKPILYKCLSFPADVYHDSFTGDIYLAETFENRILKITQKPYGVYNCSVFHQFNGRLGPVSIAMDESGYLYIVRFEYIAVRYI